ncbi:unnamed protein product, partial [Rotaria sordida]
MLQICNDDDHIYSKRLITSSSTTTQNDNNDWILVKSGHDQRPKILPEFKEKAGPTFPVDCCSSPATFYNEMPPDSLFDYIVTCTNTRARVYFDNIPSSSQSQEIWKLVSREEMKKFFAIVVQIGMIQKRSIYEYWSTDPYLLTSIFQPP